MKFFIVIIFLFTKNIYSLELKCFFEEVYQTGDMQKGFLLIKDDKLRYQYSSNRLYTIIHSQDLFYLIENKDKTKFIVINEKTEILQAVIKIIKDYPNFKEKYEIDDFIIKTEKNSSNELIKRITVLSPDVNMSIYLIDCEEKPLKNLFFSFSPVFDYK